MPRTQVVPQSIQRAGAIPTYNPATVTDGDSFVNDGRTWVHVKNGSASPVTLTIAVPQTVDGLDVADRTVSVAAGAEKVIGPFPTTTYNQIDSSVWLNWSAVADISFAVMRL